MSHRDGGGAGSRAALHLPFRPRRARRVAWTIAVAQGVVLAGLAAVLPAAGPGAFRWYDRLGVLCFAAFVGWGLSRFARLAAVPREDGLTVRNVLLSRDLDWPQVVSVRFGGGGPWAMLDLSDGETLAVMAIQRADGEYGVAQARRLATLVALHSRTERDD